MPYIYALNVWPCGLRVNGGALNLYVCLICMPYMYALHVWPCGLRIHSGALNCLPVVVMTVSARPKLNLTYEINFLPYPP